MKKIAFGFAMLVLVLACNAGQAAEEKSKAQDFKGTAGCAHCNYAAETKVEKCGTAMKVGDVVYIVKAAEGADEAVKKSLTKKTFKGDVTVTGTVEEKEGVKTILATAVSVAEAGK